MSSPLLATKFYYPPPRPEQVKRSRLLARLNECLARRLALISAPAGYGKTTLVIEWLGQIPNAKVAWISLDDGDNDPARFLNYLITAIQKAEPGSGERALAILHSPRIGNKKVVPAETLLNLLVNDLALISDPIVLILEDYHVIQSKPIHEYITYLLDHMSSNIHMVITSRAEPPLPLSRLRGRGQLVELRMNDMRFTDEEAGEFFNRSMSLNLDLEKMAVLSERTEGWITGLQMAAISISGRDEVDTFINDFAGSNRYIMDYLVEEVLQQQPEYIQQFLNDTCLLDRLCGDLCDAVLDVTGRSGNNYPLPSSASILSSLERSNLFIVPLDDRQEWYRYHRLFADLLRKRLGQNISRLAPQIHKRASQWFEQNGYLAEAIDHSLSAGDLDRAACLIDQAADSILRRSETGLFLAWVGKLPVQIIKGHPSLSIYYALALILTNHKLEDVESYLDQAQAAASGGALDGEADTLRGLLSMLEGDIQKSIQLSHQALDHLPEERLLFKSLAADNLGMCYVLSGDVPAAITAFEEVVRISQGSGNIMMAAAALANLAGLQFVQGRLHETWTNFQKILDMTTVPGGRRLPAAGKALIGLGELAREWNDLEAAASYQLEAIELLSQYVEIGVTFCYLSLARVRQAQENLESAWELLSKAKQLSAGTRSIHIDDRLVEVAEARYWIQQGDLDQALSWAQKRNLDASTLAGFRSGVVSHGYDIAESEYLTLARLYIAQDLPDKAMEILSSLQAIDEQKGRVRRLIEVLCLQALALQALGDAGNALSVMHHALALARPEGFVRTFIDEGAPVLDLLMQAIHQGIEPEYASRLVAVMLSKENQAQKIKDTGAASKNITLIPPRGPQFVLIEPLSDREMEVLQLVSDGLTNPEIGARLVISLSTVKGHTANIYSKLGVNSRTQAVARARELGFLA